MSEERKSELRMVSVMEVIIAVIVILILLLFVQQQEHERELDKMGVGPLKKQIEELKKTIRVQEQEITALKETIENQKNLIDYYVTLLAEKNPDLAGEISKLQTEKNVLAARNAGLKKQAAQLQAQIAAKTGAPVKLPTLDLPPCYFDSTRIIPHGDLIIENGFWRFEIPAAIEKKQNASKIIDEMRKREGLGELLKSESLAPKEFYEIADIANKSAKNIGDGCVYFFSYDESQLGRELPWPDFYKLDRYFYKVKR